MRTVLMAAGTAGHVVPALVADVLTARAPGGVSARDGAWRRTWRSSRRVHVLGGAPFAGFERELRPVHLAYLPHCL